MIWLQSTSAIRLLLRASAQVPLPHPRKPPDPKKVYLSTSLASCFGSTSPNHALHQRFLSTGLKPRRLNGLDTKKVPSNDDRSWGYWTASAAVIMFALSFAAVPLYQLYCQAYGRGGQAVKDEANDLKLAGLKKDLSRPIEVRFSADVHPKNPWKFAPLQEKIIVHPGETALAFYRARNPLDELVIGVATYSILPYEAGRYFNKIQCFCFDEQMLKPHEDMFLPILFYIDPEFSKDPSLASTFDVLLQYTFYRSKDGELIGPDQEDDLVEYLQRRQR